MVERCEEPDEAAVEPDVFVGAQEGTVAVEGEGEAAAVFVDGVVEPEGDGVVKQACAVDIDELIDSGIGQAGHIHYVFSFCHVYLAPVAFL